MIEQIGDFSSNRLHPGSKEYDLICGLFERALSSLSKMPRLWIMYLEFLVQNRSITGFRHVLNRALQSLAITQHQRIWDIALNKFIYQTDFPVPITTCKKLFQRYIQLEPSAQDMLIDFLLEREEFSDAVEELLRLICAQDEPSSLAYFKLINVLSKNSNKLSPALVASVDLPGTIRAGLGRFPDELGNLWNQLADYYIRMGAFGKAIEVYEEALGTLSTVSDFSIVYNSYQNFLDLVIKLKLESSPNAPIEMDLERLELLLERRDELVSSVVLRQNPDNVVEWIKRAKISRFSSDQVISTFEEALRRVDVNSKNLVGRVSTLWTEFGRYYYTVLNDVVLGRQMFERAIHHAFKTVDDLANVWVEWILLELKAAIVDIDSPDDTRWVAVLETARRGISQYRGSPSGTVQSQLFRSVKLWNLALDIDESINGVNAPELVRSLYSAMIDLRVITPALLLSFSHFEQQQSNLEKAVRVLEKGVAMFPWPYCRDVWMYYLKLVMTRVENGGKRSNKLFSTERVRDLFEQVIAECPAKFLAPFLFQWYQFELKRGMARSCIAVLTRGASRNDLPEHERVQLFYLSISETLRILGAGACRKIFEDAIETFTKLKKDKLVIEFAVQYAKVESRIGEIVRARKLLEHVSQFANPKNSQLTYLWDIWRDFELEHGDQETYKEMKRVKRSVDLLYGDQYFMGGTEEVATVAAEAVGTGGIDLSKLMQSAAEYGSTTDENFIPSATFAGSRPGFVFTTKTKGTGYYREAEV